MDEHSTSSLLHTAEPEQTAMSRSSRQLAGNILITLRLRRFARRGLATLSLLLVCGLLSYSLNQTQIKPKPLEAIRSMDLVSEMESARAEADSRSAIVDLYLSRNPPLSRVGDRDAVARIRAQREQSALILVLQADRMYSQLNLRESALAEYRRVLELFPDSQAAAEARRKLADISG